MLFRSTNVKGNTQNRLCCLPALANNFDSQALARNHQIMMCSTFEGLCLRILTCKLSVVRICQPDPDANARRLRLENVRRLGFRTCHVMRAEESQGALDYGQFPLKIVESSRLDPDHCIPYVESNPATLKKCLKTVGRERRFNLRLGQSSRWRNVGWKQAPRQESAQ